MNTITLIKKLLQLGEEHGFDTPVVLIYDSGIQTSIRSVYFSNKDNPQINIDEDD